MLSFKKLKQDKIIFLEFKPFSNLKIKNDIKLINKKKLPVIISSYEYFFEIREILKRIKAFEIYDNSSRSLEDYLKTKKIYV